MRYPDYGSLYHDKKQISGYLERMEERSVRESLVMMCMSTILAEEIISLVYLYIIQLNIFCVVYCILMTPH